jgi:hypothetical protein
MSSLTTPPTKVLVDTTVLTNALLKPTAEGPIARAALKRYPERSLPQYAIKEFKRGPLRGYVWLHNKVRDCGRADAVRAIPKLYRRQNLSSTAIRALADADSSLCKELPQALAERYPGQDLGKVQTAETLTWLKTLIFRAWRRRRALTTKEIGPLSCYLETAPALLSNGLIDDAPLRCGVEDCCLRETFTKDLPALRRLLEACDQLPAKPETDNRRRALKELLRNPKRDLPEKRCIHLGDAVFAVQCPKDAAILTTNVVDHEPLASAMGVTAIAP